MKSGFAFVSSAALVSVSVLVLDAGCGVNDEETKPGGTGGAATMVIAAEAGFLEVPSRDVTVRGGAVHIGARARLFYNFEPADDAPETKPILVLFNGFAANVVRGFGTGRTTVAEGGDVVDNPASLTRLANLLYVEPRQAGFSYDLDPDASSCSSGVFNEYADAADVLFAVLRFADDHPRLAGRFYWVGESYAGVRIQWLLAFLRGAGALAPYTDALLDDRLAGVADKSRFTAGQILLEPWLLGKAHEEAIGHACLDPQKLAAVGESVGAPCQGTNACSCASAAGRSLYNYDYATAKQEGRVDEANAAHVSLDRAARLFGVPLTSIAGLSAEERARGFKCDVADADAPSQSELFSALGALPEGQAYFLPYSPLQPGKELSPTPADWRDADILGPAFVDNLRDVPTFVTDGPRDLVVPASALAPALGAVIGEARVTAVSPLGIDIAYDDGPRTITMRRYPTAGHMITMLEPAAFTADIEAWLAGPGAGMH